MKRDLIRWFANDNSANNRVRAHIHATHDHDKLSFAKGASLMAALLQTPEYLQKY